MSEILIKKRCQGKRRPLYVSGLFAEASGRMIRMINPASLTFEGQKRLVEMRVGEVDAPASPRREVNDHSTHVLEPNIQDSKSKIQSSRAVVYGTALGGASAGGASAGGAISGRSVAGQQAQMFGTEQEDAAMATLRAEMPESTYDLMRRKYNAIAPMLNHDRQAAGLPRVDYVRSAIKALKWSQSGFYEARSKFRRAFKDTGLEGAMRALVDNDAPGPQREGPLDWQAVHLKTCWEDLRLTRRQSYRSLLDFIIKKQYGVGVGYQYDYIPSLRVVVRFINEELGGDANPRRGGGVEGIKQAAGYIPRRYDDERAGDAWCLDEFELDGYPYDDRLRRRVYNYGRQNPWGESSPILHILTAVDERTTYIMDWFLTASVDTDTLVMAERMVRQYWIPLRLVADRAGRFRALAGGHVVLRKTGELVEMLSGPLASLGVKPRGSDEKNPRANRIETSIHRLYSDFCRRDFSGRGWRPPKRIQGMSGRDIRLATGVDKLVHDHWDYHCGRKGRSERCGEASGLVALSQAAEMVAGWVEEINDMKTDAAGCDGMTRRAAFNHFQDVAEIARRRPSQAAVDEAFAERLAERRVRDGAMIEFPDGKLYRDPDPRHIGLDVACSRYRRDHSRIFIECDGNGKASVAPLVPRIGTAEPEALAREMETMAHRRKAIAGVSEELARHLSPVAAPVQAGIQDSRLTIQGVTLGGGRMTTNDIGDALAAGMEDGQ